MSYRKCPTCDKIMNRKNFGRSSGVIIDICAEHGVWFDPDELTAVLDFVATGGLAESRTREAQRAKQDLARHRMNALAEQTRMSRADSAVQFSSTAAFVTALTSFDW
ncbi:MAG TPA: hypothetical protein ENK57_23090 [Polyangiaceae bacterium]|nr:hypothetical protein [Polyangiaceae bacterium]